MTTLLSRGHWFSCLRSRIYVYSKAYEHDTVQSTVDSNSVVKDRGAQVGEGAQEMIQLREEITDALMNVSNMIIWPFSIKNKIFFWII